MWRGVGKGRVPVLLVLLMVFGIVGPNVCFGENLPTAYDLRSVEGKSFSTPVKSQNVSGQWWNNVGLCWAFASLASFESSLLKQGIVTDDKALEANLSPWHLGCHIGYNHPNYTFNPTILGTNPPVPVSYALDSTLQWGWGGSVLFTVNYLSRGLGLVLESDAPLPLDVMAAQQRLTAPPLDLPSHYMLRSGLLYQRENYDSEGHFRDAIKEALMDYGAVATGMYLGVADLPGQIGHSYWRGNYNYYCDEPEYENIVVHMVTIIGWDDARLVAEAPGAGAWLIKDSLGADFHDGGYFWISYYDTVFLKGYSYAMILVADLGTSYSGFRYQTNDGALSTPITASNMYETDGFNSQALDSWACARFVAEATQTVNAVGLIALNRDEHVTIAIYRRWDEVEQKPYDLAFSQEILVKDPGYHVVDLHLPVTIDGGEEFVIAVGFRAQSDYRFEPLVYVINEEQPPEPGQTYRASFCPERGWSLWQDYSEIYPNAAFYVQGIL